jgi:nicotinate-nucleotide adenylyltransferase
VETLRHFAGALPGHSFDWIIGDDNIETLSKWRAIDEIFAMANFVVLRRGGSDRIEPALSLRIRPAPDRGRAGAIVFADNDPVVVSSTEIRERFRNGQDATGLVPPRVDRYIRRHRLYVSQED